MWNRIADEGYKIRWFNKEIYYCEYLTDGLTKKGNEVFFNNPKGWALWIRESKQYGLWSDERIYNDELYFIEHNIDVFSKKELCDMLKITEQSLEVYLSNIDYNKKQLGDFFVMHRSVALYGYGLVGERVNNYLKLVGVEPKYIIDRDKNKKCKNLFSLEDKLPNIETILITILKSPKNLKELGKKCLKQI